MEKKHSIKNLGSNESNSCTNDPKEPIFRTQPMFSSHIVKPWENKHGN